MGVITVGALVRLPAMPEWGLGQVQSIISDRLGERVTVNFENGGKQVLNSAVVELEVVAFDL